MGGKFEGAASCASFEALARQAARHACALHAHCSEACLYDMSALSRAAWPHGSLRSHPSLTLALALALARSGRGAASFVFYRNFWTEAHWTAAETPPNLDVDVWTIEYCSAAIALTELVHLLVCYLLAEARGRGGVQKVEISRGAWLTLRATCRRACSIGDLEYRMSRWPS